MNSKARRKGRALIVLWIVLGVIGVLALASVVALGVTEPERREGRNLPIGAVDFAAVPDGKYEGKYAGGMYKWRANEVRVTVSNGKVTDIEVVEARFPAPQVTEPLFDRVVKEQSLKVDTISQATITSKAFLKSVENALVSKSPSS